MNIFKNALITTDSFFEDDFHEISNKNFAGISIKVDEIGAEKTLFANALLKNSYLQNLDQNSS